MLLACVLAWAPPASAQTRSASIGNYYFADDATGSRDRIVADVGDQIAFTVREGVYPPHTVDVDELNIHSGGILLGETYTTPVLERAGTFLLYCRPHRERGHVARLVIRAAVTPAPAQRAPASMGTTPAPAAGAAQPTPAAPAAGAGQTPAPTPEPAGVRSASPAELARPQPVDPDSVEGLTGRARSRAPWTRALWWLLIASVPIAGAAAFALSRELARPPGTAPSSEGPARSPGRSRRSSGPTASGSARRSPGPRR